MTDIPQPGTPLPWHVLSENATGSIVHVDESGFTTLIAGMETQEQDAAYLVYAANELPKLVAALERANAWSQQQAIESERLLAMLDILGANADAFHQQQHTLANQTCGIECEGVTDGVTQARTLLAEMEATDG